MGFASEIYLKLGTRFAIHYSVMSELLLLVLFVSSIALSVVLSRLAVGEMFRLVRITRIAAPARVERPPVG